MERFNFYGAPANDAPLSTAGGTAGFADILGAAIDQMRFVDNTNAQLSALEEAYGRRSREIKAATGIDLGNPILEGAAPTVDASGFLVVDTDRARAAYADRLQQLQLEYPQAAATIRAGVPIEREAEELARAADERVGELMASNPSWSASGTLLAGGMAGSLRDPLTLGSLFVGGGPGAGRTVFGRLLSVAAREALINAGTEAAAQPFTQAWRAEAGLPNGFDQAAQNVLLAAALGGAFGLGAGGTHELVRALKPVRHMLPAEQRGALDIAEATAAIDATVPDGLPLERFDRQVETASAALEGHAPAISEPDEVTVRQITDSLAPAPDSVPRAIGTRTDAEIDALVLGQPKQPEGAQRAPKPIIDHIRRLGGVDPASPVAAELRAIGADAPSLYKRGGLRSLDNLPHDELPAEVRHAIEGDGNGYAREQAILDAIARELEGDGHFDLEPGGARDFYERHGVDFSRPIEEVRDQVRAVDELEHRWTADTDEAVTVPAGMGRREYTAQLVREVLRAQPGLPDQIVRDAVNLALFERQPILEALSDVMSDAAGVPRERELIGKAYDRVLEEPEGPAGDPLVEISPKELEGAVLERGALRGVSEVDIPSKRGFGLVKIIWKHGEKSAKAARVSKDDVLALPVVIRNFAPSSTSGRGREWRVERDGRSIVYADSVHPDGRHHVVTIYVDEKGGPLSPRASQPVPPRVLTTPGDTAGELSTALPGAAERPVARLEQDAGDGNLEEPDLDLSAELEALEELGFTGGVLPIGDGLVSFRALEEEFEALDWETKVLEACKV